MDINAIRKKRAETEDEILRLLTELAEQTLLVVQDVKIEKLHFGGIDGPGGV